MVFRSVHTPDFGPGLQIYSPLPGREIRIRSGFMMLDSIKDIIRQFTRVDQLDEIEEIEEINLLTEDDAATALKKGISNMMDTIVRKTIARTEELGEFDNIDEIEEVIKRNRSRQERLKQGLILALTVLILGCVISIGSSVRRYAERIEGIFAPLKKVGYLVDAGQPEKAYFVLKKVVVNPDDPKQVARVVDYYLQVADYYYMTPSEIRGANMKHALKIYETILMKFTTLDPGLKAQVAFRQGRCFERLFVYSRAIESFAMAAELLPGTDLAEKAQYRIGLNHLNNDAYDEARDVFSTFIEEYPESRLVQSVFYRLGDSHFQEAGYLTSHIGL
jgi:tetratricopeptide (TPR) repeat protein